MHASLGVAKSASRDDTLSFEDRLALLVDAEFSERDTTQFSKRLKSAKLRDTVALRTLTSKRTVVSTNA